MVVQHNLTAMNSNRMLGVTTGAQKKSSEKLSSGYKINRAADDAAGLSISEKMRRQIRGLTQASANAEDGISAVQTAEGALNEVHDMLQRMNELANKAANGTNSKTDRQSIQDEISQLTTEIDRVSETTKFNELYLMKGGAGEKEVKLQGHDAGLDGILSDQTDTATFTATLKTDTDYAIGGKNYHIYDEGDTLDSFQNKIDSAKSVTINGTTYTRMGTSDNVNASAGAAKLESAAEKMVSAAGKATSASTKAGSVAVKNGSVKLAEASAVKKEASVAIKQGSVAIKTESASIKQASADSKNAEANKLLKKAETASAAGNASATAYYKACAATYLTSAATLAVSASTLSGSAATLSSSANTLAASAATLQASAAALQASAATLQGSADILTTSAGTLQASADTMNACARALLGESDDADAVKFISNEKEYLAGELKSMIVDGAKVGINGVKERTAVDTVNNLLNKTLDEVKGLIKDALNQANRVGVDDTTKVSVTDAEEKGGDQFEYTITKGSVTVAKDLDFNLHVGADADLTNKIGVGIAVMDSKYLGVHGLQVVDDTGNLATYAIDAIEDAITKVNEQRSALGAVQNRLEHTIKNVDNVVENTTAAESQIRDTDMASEMVRYSNNNILMQAGQSMLAQANQSNQGVLSLLG